jgi:hypothetical protein
MNNLQLGKMYLVKEYFWFLFPKKGMAKPATAWPSNTPRVGGEVAEMNAKWLSEHYNCNVDVVEPNTCFVLLEMDERFYKLLDCNGNIGWTYCFDFSGYFELVKE